MAERVSPGLAVLGIALRGLRMQAYHSLVAHLLTSGEPCVFDGCYGFPVLYLIQSCVGVSFAPVCWYHWVRHHRETYEGA